MTNIDIPLIETQVPTLRYEPKWRISCLPEDASTFAALFAEIADQTGSAFEVNGKAVK